MDFAVGDHVYFDMPGIRYTGTVEEIKNDDLLIQLDPEFNTGDTLIYRGASEVHKILGVQKNG